ncbi:MAG: hypothetical protein ABGZ17_04215 [Planctomycetaceae bacterium]
MISRCQAFRLRCDRLWQAGRVMWTHIYDCPYTMVASYAIGSRVTPTVDGDRVDTLGAEGHLLCLSVTDGRPLWSHDLRMEYGVKTPLWGFWSHPAFAQRSVYLRNDAEIRCDSLAASDRGREMH